MFEYRGKTALVTGASYGIGAAFVEALAGRGMNVILVARSGEAMNAIAKAASDKHKVRTEVIVADLSKEGAVESVKAEIALWVPLQRLVPFCKRPLDPPSISKTNLETGASGTVSKVLRIRENASPCFFR